MAATQTVPHALQSCNSIELLTPRRGVLTLFGFGIKVRVDRGHLAIEDGIANNRRAVRLPRVRHGLKRLIVIGSDGMVSLAALRWLADQDAAFVMLERDGTVLVTTGPVRSSDARLRRAQGLAHQSVIAVEIARELISEKLVAQERLASDGLNNSAAAQTIARAREAISGARTLGAIRLLESRGALAYWNAWRLLPINFPNRDLHRLPDHWRSFGNRFSPLTGSPRLAANPANAILNYLYAVLESEARLAVAALGLDPGLGVLHVDVQCRDSLALDVMEPVRPLVDAYLLDWIRRETFKREWFFEQRDGNCRLTGSFAVRLSETAPTWGRAAAPLAERVSQMLWSTIPTYRRRERPATRLTQASRREAKGITSGVPPEPPPHPQSFCRNCGATIGRGRTCCATCSNTLNTAGLIKAAELGRVASHTDQAEARRAETQRQHATARATWQTSALPDWLNKDTYIREIQPRLKGITLSIMASKLRISIPYAVQVRSGRRIPHPRHWETLAQLVGISSE
jgi:CRISPR-associated endonuclease Cas1